MEIKVDSSVADPDPAYETDCIWICILVLPMKKELDPTPRVYRQTWLNRLNKVLSIEDFHPRLEKLQIQILQKKLLPIFCELIGKLVGWNCIRIDQSQAVYYSIFIHTNMYYQR